MATNDALLYFTTVGTPYAPTTVAANLAPNQIDTSPLTVPSGSGGAGAVGYGGLANANAGRDLGVGTPIWLEILVTTSVAQTSGGVTFQLLTDDNTAMSSAVTLFSSANFAAASLAAGARPVLVALPISALYERYLGLTVTIVSNVLTAGAFEARLLLNPQASDLYQSGFTIQ